MCMRCRMGCTVFVQGLGAHKALCAFSAGAYGWSDGLPHSLLSPSYSQLSLSLLCALSPSFSCCCCSVGKWMGLLFAASASHSVKLHHASGAEGWCACVRSACTWFYRIGSGIYSLCVCACLCVGVLFENASVGVCLARSFSTLHAGLEQADKLFAKTGN